MTSKGNAMAIAILKIAELFGKEYIRSNFDKACHSYPDDDAEQYDYFCGFKGDNSRNLWTEFAYVRVDRHTEEATFLDYRLPDGTRMKKPVKPIRLAQD